MELWLLLGIAAYFLYALSSSVDKHLMNEEESALAVNSIKMLLDGFVILVIGVFFLNFEPSIKALKFSAFLGVLYAVAGVLYFKVLQEMDANVAIPVAHSSKIAAIFVLSILLLGEFVLIENWIGVIFISLGVFFLLSRGGLHSPDLNKGMKFLLANLAVGIAYRLSSKVLLADINPETLSTIMYFTSGIFLVAYQRGSKSMEGMRSILDSKKLPKVGLAALFGGSATLLLFKALEIAQASQVYPLAGAQSLFIAVIASIFLGEGLSIKKVAGIVSIVIGIFLVQI